MNESKHSSLRAPSFGALERLKPVKPETYNQDSPYILCNEAGQEKSLKALAELSVYPPLSSSYQTIQTKPTVHIGFSVWFNLDLLAITKPDYSIVLDVDPKVHLIYEHIESAFKEAENPKKFVEVFLTKIVADKRSILQFPKEYQKRLLEEEMRKDTSFLFSQDFYNNVRKVVAAGKVFFGRADITNKQDIDAIASWCTKNNMKVKTLYLSNIPEWIANQPSMYMRKLKENVNSLISENTIVIDAFYPTVEKDKQGPPQRLIKGKLPCFEKQQKRRALGVEGRAPRVRVNKTPISIQASMSGWSSSEDEENEPPSYRNKRMRLPSSTHSRTLAELGQPLQTQDSPASSRGAAERLRLMQATELPHAIESEDGFALDSVVTKSSQTMKLGG